ncbi:hypothetical protein QBC35DRAFT_100332 [Podospora australis]|uniref:Zonadhesin n=1 Tax=Podospora australis TaxID=1536484 RepID=A0AAN7AP36_9PEZI|nr:hypothetical protein QBC35DRAFT_100332 [Podospora australis]
MQQMQQIPQQAPYVHQPLPSQTTDNYRPYEYSIQATEDYHYEDLGPQERREEQELGSEHPQQQEEDTVPAWQPPSWRPTGTPNYKPKPLRWPFITAVIVMLLVTIVLVVVAEMTMPNSDTSARILGLHPNASQPGGQPARRLLLAREDNSTTEDVTASAVPEIVSISGTAAVTSVQTSTFTPDKSVLSKEGPSTGPEDDETINVKGQQSSLVMESKSQTLLEPPSAEVSSAKASESSRSGPPIRVVPSTVTRSIVAETTSLALSGSLSRATGSTDFNFQAIETETPSSTVSPSRSTISVVVVSGSGSLSTTGSTPSTTRSPTVTSLPSGYSLVSVSVSVSRFTQNITIPVSTIMFTTTITRTRTSSFTSASSYTTTIFSSFTSVFSSQIDSTWSASGSQGTIPMTTVMGTSVLPTTIVSDVTTKIGGVSTVLETITRTFASTVTGVVIPRVGEVTFTFYSTLIPPTINVPINKPEEPVKVTSVEVINESVVTRVHTQAPVVITVGPTQEVKTKAIEEEIRTGVTRVGGSEVINTVVITPVPGVRVSVVTNVGGTPVTEVRNPSPVTNIRVVDGKERTIVETPPPQTVVRTEGGVIKTIEEFLAPGRVGQPVTLTVVNTPGGTPVTQVVVTTPAGPPFQPISYTVVRDEGGRLVTDVVVTTPTAAQALTYTAVNIVGGKPVTEVFVTTPAGEPFQPVSYVITTNVGGTPTVIAVTPDPTTFVTTIDGTAVTRVTTPPVTSFTTTIGGTLTTQTIVTTPTGTSPITLTFVSSSGGTLSTFTSTISGTTYLSTISGSLRTITSTPSASTSLSTRSAITRTHTSTLDPTSTNVPESDKPNVIEEKKVYKWTEADIFLGTFLPALLGVALVIPLRIIDLNVKLYQPFQSLARDKGGSGSETVLMQYTGVMGFLTPVVTMLQGHPVPFITTLMVGCASFMVPLATEAIGLKLHGECYLNTASNRCAPALGVSPTPAKVLMALIAVVIVMLCLVLFFMTRYITGLYSNPWNIAGIASLAGNAQIRIQQNSEEGMKRALAEKQFGLGYFTNAAGREDYGIILKDEAGRSLQPQQSHGTGGAESDSLSELFDANAAAAKAGGSGNHLPFMTLRYPWRIGLILFQLGVFVFIVVYHAYYRGGIRDGGKFWTSLTANTFGVRFISAVVGVVIAFCWQSFFLSVSTMTPYQLMAKKTQTAQRSILFSPCTNPFSGIYSAIKHKHIFLLCVSVAAILSEFLPVLLANVPFSLHQTSIAATACAVLSLLFLAVMLSVLIGSFFVRWPPMPVDPRCIAGVLYYVSQSHMLDDLEGVSRLEGKAKAQRVMEAGRRYYYGLLATGTWRRLGVDCDIFAGDESGTSYQGAAGVYSGYHGNGHGEDHAYAHGGGDLSGGGYNGGGGSNLHAHGGYYQVGSRIDEQPAMY